MIPIDGVIGFHGALQRIKSEYPRTGRSAMYEKEKDSNALVESSSENPRMVGHGGMAKMGYTLPALSNRMLPIISLFLILIVLPHSALALIASQPKDLLASEGYLQSRAPNETAQVLECLQVSPPVLSPAKPSCSQTLMVHTFGWSYGKPFVGEYTPPACQFNRITINFTATSAGRQFDRLALMFLNDTEVWRTSTAEPTQKGIVWTYIKDMSNYVSLFKEQQKIIFDLGNIVDDTYTGSWNTTLTATFFTADDDIEPADTIIPISARRSADNSPSAFVVPESKALDALTLPRNTKKAIFSISACGQAAEEFWWSNVLSSDTQVFGNESTLYGYSPFRELQLYIDGTLAGVAWPFPVIFTGGIVPGFWRPVVGIDAFDLREDEIDITPFVPILSDGGKHTFEIRVAGINDDGKGVGYLTDTVGSNWVVTGKLFLWLDAEGDITTGTPPTISSPNPILKVRSSVQRGSNGTVKSLDYSVAVSRRISITSTLTTSAGSQPVTWSQNLTYSNEGRFSNGGNDQTTTQSTSGSDSASNSAYAKKFSYPLYVYSTYNVLAGGNFTIEGKLARGKDVEKIGELAFPSELKTFSRAPQYGASGFTGTSSSDLQNGTATYLSVPALKRSFGTGRTEQRYWLYGIEDAVLSAQEDVSSAPGQAQGQASITELYRRHVLASNDSLILDEEIFGGGGEVTVQSMTGAQQPKDQPIFAKGSIRALLGRGPF